MEAVNGVSEVDKGGPPAPSPLTGCYLLVVVGEPHSKEHKDIILRRIAKGLLSWDISDCHVDLEKELAIITEQGPEGEDARYGERLIQFASENLVTEILIHPAISTLSQCMKNLLSSFTRHRHIIHAGYTFAANGSWILQDGTFSLTDFSEAFQEMEVQRVLRAYDNSISLDIHCSPEGDWTRLPKESFTKNSKVRVNPDDVLTSGSPSIVNFLNYISPFLLPTDIETLLESSDVVGNIRFSHPTLYVFPGGQGDAALFGINGFNMLVDGGFARKACFWDFVRHLDRLDAVLVTRLNNSNVSGISSVLRRKRFNTVYPQIGHFFCNIQERKAILSPDGDKDKDPLIVNLLEEGQEIISNLRQLHLHPQACYRDIEPINLYHKVGHGTLDMYVLSPAKESKEVREFIQKWNTNDQRLFANQRNGRDFTFPTQNLVSICALLVWQPANANDSITRILFPGSTPQHKIFEGLDRLKQLECIKYPSCSAKTLTPSLMKSKQAKVEKMIQQDQKENKKERLVQQPETKAKVENKVAEENIKNIQTNGVTTHQVITEKIIKKHDSTESEKSGPPSGEAKKTEEGKEPTNLTNGKPAEEKVEKSKPKAKPEQKPKVESKVYKHTRSIERKPKVPAEKKASPTTPKKSLDAKVNGDGPAKPKTLTKISPSATPAKSTKEANNRKVLESKYKVAPKKDISKPDKKDSKPERKPISRRPKESSPSGKVLESPVKKLNELHKVEARKSKLEKEGTTDSSTVSTPSADADTAMKKDISKLTPEELEQLKARELAELKEEQEVVKEIEAVFRKSEHKVADDSDLRKVKNISVDDKTEAEGEEYLIIEKEEIEHDSLDEKETKESETQKHLRDSEESEKQRKLSGEVTVEVKDIKEEKLVDAPTLDESAKLQENEATPTVDVVKTKDDKEPHKEVSKEVSAASPDDKVDVSSGKKATDRDIDEENKDGNILESQPDEKFSTPIESGATTAPTLPEDERIPLDEIKEDNGDQHIEEKYVKEDTKEKEIPVVQLPPKTTEAVAKLPTVVGIRLDKQTPIRDLVKTPDEVADLPVHEEVDIENYEHFHATQSQAPKQEESKQVSPPKEVKLDKAEKPEEKVSTAGEEKEPDKKILGTQKVAEEKQQEPTKAVEAKDKLVAADEAKEAPIKVAEVEVLQAKPPVKEELSKADHAEDKVDLEKEILEKAEEKVDEEKQDVKEDVYKVAEKVEEGIEEVATKADHQKKEHEEVPEQKHTEKVDIEKPIEKDTTEKVEAATVDPKEIKQEKETLSRDIEKKEIEKETEEEDVQKPEAEKGVSKTEVEKTTEVDVEKADVQKLVPKVIIVEHDIETVAEKEDLEKTEIQGKVEEKKDEAEKSAETEVLKMTPKVDIEKETVIEKEVEVKEPVEKMDATKVEVDKSSDKVSGIKTEAEKAAAKVDKQEMKKDEEVTEKTDLGKEEEEEPSVEKLKGAVAREELHVEQIVTDQATTDDAKVAETKVKHQEKVVKDTTKDVKQESHTKLETTAHRDQQNDDVEAKIVAIEKELVAVITEEVKDIEKLDEKTDAPEKEQKAAEVGKVDVEKEKPAAKDVREDTDAVKETKEEKQYDGGKPTEIKADESIHGKVIEEKSIERSDEKVTKPHDKEDIKHTVQQSEEKTEGISTQQAPELYEDKITTTEVKDLKVTTEIKSDDTKKEDKKTDKEIVEPGKSDLKLQDDIVLEKVSDVVVPHLKSVEQTKQEIKDVPSIASEVKEEIPITVKSEIKDQIHGDEHINETNEQKLEKTSQVDGEKTDLKDSEKEKVEKDTKSDVDKDSKTEKDLVGSTAITIDIAEMNIKPHDECVLEEKLDKVVVTILDTCEKVEAKELLTDKAIVEGRKEKTDEQKDTQSNEIEKFTKEKIHEEAVTIVEAEKKVKDDLSDLEKTDVKSEIAAKDSEHDLKELDTLGSEVFEPKEVKEISDKKESLKEDELIGVDSGEKHLEKGAHDVKDVEKVDQHHIKSEVADIKLDDEKSDKEKSAVEQKEEDTGKSDKILETATMQPRPDQKLDQKGETAEEDKEEKLEIKSVDGRDEKKIHEEEKESISEKGEDKKEGVLPQTAQEIQIETPTEKEKEKLTTKDEKEDECKKEKLFKDEELTTDVKSVPTEKRLTAEVGEFIKETADDIAKEVAKDVKKLDILSKSDEKETYEEKQGKDLHEDEVCKVEKILEKVEEASAATAKETEAQIEEDLKTDKKISAMAAEPKIEETVLNIAADLGEPLKKVDSSVNEQEHKTDAKVSKSDVTKLPEDDKPMVVEYTGKQIEPEQISISIEKLVKAPLLETSKTEEKTVEQGEKDFVGEAGEKTAIKSVHDDSLEINKIDKKLQELKETVDGKAESTYVDLDHSFKSQSQSKNEIDVVDKLELGRKSPKEREHDVAKIVASVAEVLKSDAPLEEFEGKIPLEITTFDPYELRETHITTVESPIREDLIADQIQMRPIEEEKSSPRNSISVFLDEERKVAPVHTDYDNFQKEESRVSSLLKDSNELIQATSKIISDIKQSSKVDDDVVSEDVKETSLLSKTHKILEEASVTAKDLVAVESKKPKLEKPSSVLDESSPEILGVKEEPLDTKKESLDIKESDIKVESPLFTEKSTPDVKEDAVDIVTLQTSSGKSSPEIKEPPRETVGVDKSLISSGKTSPDSKESIKDILIIDKSPIMSGKTTPDLREDITNVPILEQIWKIIPDVKAEEVSSSGKSTPEILEDKKSDTDTSKPTDLSGKSSPDIKATTEDLVASGKATPEIKEMGHVEKATPEIKETATDLSKSIVDPKTIVSDVKHTVESSLEATPITSGKSAPEIKELVTELSKPIVESEKLASDVKGTEKSVTPITSGKSTPESKELLADLSKSVKVIPDVKEIAITSLDTTPETSGKITPEKKEPVADLSKSIIESKKIDSDVKVAVKSSVDTAVGTTTPEIKESVTDVSKSLDTEELTSYIKETVKSSAEATPIISGKTATEMKEPFVDLSKSIIDSEKPSSDVKDLDTSPVASGKTTPEIKEPITDLSKSVADSAIVASDIKEAVKSSLDASPMASGKTTPDITEPITDLSKSVVETGKIASDIKETVKSSLDTSPIISGKTTPEIKEPIVDLVKSVIESEKIASVEKETVKSSLDTSPIASGKTTPEIKEPAAELSHSATDSASDVKESVKTSLDKSHSTSEKTTPAIKEVVTEIPKTLVGSEKLTSEIKESTKSSLDTSPVASGKTTPEIKEPTVSKDDISSGKTSPDFVDKATTKDEKVKASLATDQTSIISGKSTPEIVEPVKDTLDTSKSPILSGKSTPDIVIDEDKSSVASGRSTPDTEKPVDKHLDDLEKSSTDKTDLVTTKILPDAKESTTHIETDKKIVETEKSSSEVKVTEIGPLQSKISPLETKQSGVQDGLSEPVKATVAPTDTSKTSETPEKLSSHKSKSPVTSGKSTPDLHHSTEKGADQMKPSIDSRKSSLMEHIDTERTSSASGKSTPELKDPVLVLSDRTTPDTKLPAEKDSVKPEISTSDIKSTPVIFDSKVTEVKDHQTISEHAPKIESIAGPSSSTKDALVSSSKSPSEELEYSRKSTPDIADITKTKDLDESSLGRTTPPTVPVSPVVKEKHPSIHDQEKSDKKDVPEVCILKTTEARSSTPASDDCDISSGQVSRVLTTEEDDEKQIYSDDDDLPGSPLSATSQVAHSTSSQYDFEDSVRGVGPVDPMSTSFYGALPDDPVDLSKGAKTSRFLDEADLDFDKALHEHRQTRGEDLTARPSPSHVYEITTAKYSSLKLQEKIQIQTPVASAPVTIKKESVMTSSFIGSELPTGPKDDPIASWGKPLGLPSPAPLNDNKGTPKKERRIPPNVMAKNKLNEDKKLSDSKYDRRGKKINPVYVDLTYVPHHGNSNYSYVDFFKRVRARYYVFSGIEPSKDVYNALLEAKQTWDDKELEVTIIPTYDTDVLGYWVAENEDLLAKYKIDLSPSASRCTINLQDHETSCSAYRLEFS